MSEDLIKHGGLNEGLDFGQVERGTIFEDMRPRHGSVILRTRFSSLLICCHGPDGINLTT